VHCWTAPKSLFLILGGLLPRPANYKMSHNTKSKRMGKIVTGTNALTVKLVRV
jgi:hypothetical protein